jgi:hypothetical protein
MKILLSTVILGVVCLAGTSFISVDTMAETHGPHTYEINLSDLDLLPIGLSVSHSPEEVKPSLFGPTGSQYTHQTSVASTVGPVTIVEYGYLVERDGHWTHAQGMEEKFSAAEFAKFFNCPEARLEAGRTYTDEWNSSVINNRPEQLGKWYFIGVDAQGNRVKGEADIKLISGMTGDGC